MNPGERYRSASYPLLTNSISIDSGSHRVYMAPWTVDPRVTIQNSKGQARAYQAKQVLRAIDRLEIEYAKR
jgi:hypothetical protein